MIRSSSSLKRTPGSPKLCECGCGGVTPPAKRTNPHRGLVAGEPLRFIKGHNHRKSVAPECGYVVEPDSGCWIWRLNVGRDGYGKAACAGRGVMAHRMVWERVNGPVPDGLVLDHLCRNRRCVNPAHLEPVTHTENNRRSRATKLTKEQVAFIRDSTAPHREVAERFGVTVSNIAHIRNGRSWKAEL